MEGHCQNCGALDILDCCYNPFTGQEIYICSSCQYLMSNDDKQNLADQ